VDPLTLFALANGAVAAVKKGCQLYKDIKSAAGDVKGVLKDLDDQFQKLHPPSKPASTAQKNAYIEEKNRVIELNKKQGETTSIYTELGEHLGTYYDNYYKCMILLDEEERRSREELYTGDDSLGKRALQRVLMKKQLDQMGVELREIMIYQSPPELGALYTEVNEMMTQLSKEQKVLFTKKVRADQIIAERKRQKMKAMMEDLLWAGAVLIVGLAMVALFAYISHDRKVRWPELEPEVLAKKRQERRQEHLDWLRANQERQKREDEEFRRNSEDKSK
jgi:hypothetical protein